MGNRFFFAEFRKKQILRWAQDDKQGAVSPGKIRPRIDVLLAFSQTLRMAKRG